MASTTPRRRTVSDIRSKLLKPATTSHFDVFITQPSGSKGYTWDQFKADNNLSGFDQDFLHLCCSETVLPGSSLTTTEINNDYTGVTERHAYRRLFDDRIDLTFYVMIAPSGSSGLNNTYLPIRFFESWIKYISAEQEARQGNNVTTPNYSYRMRYPKEYYGGLEITKYERDYKSFLTYNFVNIYPISVSSMPISYESSDLLKCTVSFSYIRYYINGLVGSGSKDKTTTSETSTLSPLEQASFNGAPSYFTNPEFGVSTTTGGVSQQNANNSGNRITLTGQDYTRRRQGLD